jgi:hypothetical protein
VALVVAVGGGVVSFLLFLLLARVATATISRWGEDMRGLGGATSGELECFRDVDVGIGDLLLRATAAVFVDASKRGLGGEMTGELVMLRDDGLRLRRPTGPRR